MKKILFPSGLGYQTTTRNSRPNGNQMAKEEKLPTFKVGDEISGNITEAIKTALAKIGVGPTSFPHKLAELDFSTEQVLAFNAECVATPKLQQGTGSPYVSGKFRLTDKGEPQTIFNASVPASWTDKEGNAIESVPKAGEACVILVTINTQDATRVTASVAA